MRKTTRSETFILNDARSVKRLSQNVRGEENSARSYFWFLHALLPSVGGVIEQADLEAAVLKHYGPGFGPDDRRTVGKGRFRQPKWKNSLAWAKVMARSSHEFCGEAKGVLGVGMVEGRRRLPGGGFLTAFAPSASRWRRPDPPKFIWSNLAGLPEWVKYEADEAATETLFRELARFEPVIKLAGRYFLETNGS